MPEVLPGKAGSRPLSQTVRDVVPFGFLVLAVWLAWQIICAPITERGPVDVAMRLAPTSPMVLRRAAEAELAAGQFEDAQFLARRALAGAPFSVRSLSTLGMAVAKTEGDAAADDIITLAGNWSLRDDPTHAWLMHARLRTGDYRSAFAHADTLVRRRDDIQPQVFRLFTTAAGADPRSLSALVVLVGASPPWRRAFLDHLYDDAQGDALLANLAVGLQMTPSPLDDDELGRLYDHWVHEQRLPAIRAVRARIGRPETALIMDGGFSDDKARPPFAWRLHQRAGLTASVTDDDLREGELALRVEYDGVSSEAGGAQFMQLPPGSYRLKFEGRHESGAPTTGLAWRVSCISGAMLTEVNATFAEGDSAWRSFERTFTVPAGCEDQWIALSVRPTDRSLAVVAWFDRFIVQSIP